jgi:hypothetical protein
MATIAVFIALGAGAYAAVNLPKNSVKSKHIKNAQVKNKDLRDEAVSAAKLRGDVRPLHFDGELNIGSLADVLLDENGYRIAMSCQDEGGSPEVDATLRVPEDGTLDFQSVTSETGDPGQSAAAHGEVEAASAFPIQVSDPAPGDVRTTGAVITYTGSTRAAVLTIHGVADDDTIPNRCVLNGSLIPLTQAE